jgi:hypothetical protein
MWYTTYSESPLLHEQVGIVVMLYTGVWQVRSSNFDYSIGYLPRGFRWVSSVLPWKFMIEARFTIVIHSM